MIQTIFKSFFPGEAVAQPFAELGVVRRFLVCPVNESQAKPAKKRALLVIAGILLLGLSVVALLRFFALPDDLCANDNLRESISPNGTLKAVLFRRACGATTAYSTQVSILPASRKLPDEAGNVFVVGGELLVVVRWLDDRHLSISGGGAPTAFKHLSAFNGVQVTYD